METAIYNILNDMTECLSIQQMKKLQEVLLDRLETTDLDEIGEIDNYDYLEMFITAKRIEGCSERTLQYYKSTIENLLLTVDVLVRKMTTEILREYLANYQSKNNCGKVTIDNVRRNLSSFFSWLEEENHILKSPMRRIHKIRTKTIVKEVITDEGMEELRDNCDEPRDLAIIDLLASTGMRVGEFLLMLRMKDCKLVELK